MAGSWEGQSDAAAVDFIDLPLAFVGVTGGKEWGFVVGFTIPCIAMSLAVITVSPWCLAAAAAAADDDDGL